MEKRTILFLFVIYCTINVQGLDWNFWKKGTTTTSTTTTTTTTTQPILTSTHGQNLPTNANKERLPIFNPGTEVGQNFSPKKPTLSGVGGSNGNDYRNWAIDITGAGREQAPNQATNQKPINGNNQQRPQGVAPAAVPTTSTTFRTSTTSTTPKVSTTSTTPKVSTTSTTPKVSTTSTTPKVSTTSTTVRPLPTQGLSYAGAVKGGSPSPTLVPRINAEPIPAKPSTGNEQVKVNSPARTVYSSNPKYSKGNTVTDEDLEKLSEALFIKDKNNANKYITLNLQKKTTSSSTVDEAPQPLIQINNGAALQSPTYQRVQDIYDNYNLDTKTNEYISPKQRQEEIHLIDTFLSTDVMAAAVRFLADKGFVHQSFESYQELLRILWFNLYSRGGGKIGSTGFEHVFLTEIKDSEIYGLHNWIYLSSEEAKNRANYLGYLKKVDLGDKASILKIHVKFNGIIKPITTLFVGTSPELEMALYTVCFITRPDKLCPVSLGGTKFNIMTHKFRYRGKDHIGSAYPEI